MIRAVFIIRQGICVFSSTYDINLEVSKDLLAGFLSALPAFAKEIEEDQELESFKLSGYQFVFKPLKNTSDAVGNFMVLLADAKDKETTLRKILDLLVEKFEKEYNLDDWNSNLKEFEGFKVHTDKIIFHRDRKPLEVSPEMLATISDIISSSKYNFLILNKDNDIVLTSLKSISKEFTIDVLNDIKDAVIQYSIFPPIFGSKLETSFINTDKMVVVYDKILDHFFIAFMMKDSPEWVQGTMVNAYDMLQNVMEALDEIRFSLMTLAVYDSFKE
ncbi:MAG: hypothetical protein ACTSXP_07075 [Promethearchaeota archaeon]